MAPAPEAETAEESETRKADYEQRTAEYQADEQRKEEERKQQFEQQQKEYEAEQTRREKQRKARLVTFNRILTSAPPTFSAAQLRVFLNALINLDPYDFAEDVAAFYVGSDENNQKTTEEVLYQHRHITRREADGVRASSRLDRTHGDTP
jgi:ParB family chromosome partitioning protein